MNSKLLLLAPLAASFLLTGCFVVVDEADAPDYYGGTATYGGSAVYVGRPYYNRPYYNRPYARPYYRGQGYGGYGYIDRPYLQDRRAYRRQYYQNDD